MNHFTSIIFSISARSVIWIKHWLCLKLTDNQKLKTSNRPISQTSSLKNIDRKSLNTLPLLWTKSGFKRPKFTNSWKSYNSVLFSLNCKSQISNKVSSIFQTHQKDYTKWEPNTRIEPQELEQIKIWKRRATNVLLNPNFTKQTFPQM